MSNAVLWQHMFQVVAFVLGAVLRATHAAQHPVQTPQHYCKTKNFGVLASFVLWIP
jgi:hypothetical protein